MIDKIYIINGVSGSGKDEFVKAYSRESLCNVINISSVQPVKDMLAEAGLYTRDETGRLIVSDIKDMLDESLDYTIKYIRNVIEEAKEDDYCNVLFIHIREEYLISMISALYSVKTLLITNKSIVDMNEKDSLVGKAIIYDYEIDNSFMSRDIITESVFELMRLEDTV